jgi:hypothetical protein
MLKMKKQVQMYYTVKMALQFTVEQMKNYVKDIDLRFHGVLLILLLEITDTVKTEDFHHFT